MISGAYTDSHPVIVMFWDIVVQFTEQQKRQLLKFVTSCSRPPLLGFKVSDLWFILFIISLSWLMALQLWNLVLELSFCWSMTGKQDGRVVSTPAFGSEGPRFDPLQQPFVQLSLWWFKQSHTNSWSLISLFTVPSFGWDVKPRPRVNCLTGAGTLN